MTTLIYHRNISGDTSPFDEAILRVSEQTPLKLVSPFISVDYLDRLIRDKTDWFLISDIEAWLSSLSQRARPKTLLFITENLQRIHHCPAIHAKTVIGQTLAYLGSANLTSAGILARTELGALIDDPKLIVELHAWFDDQWLNTQSPSIEETGSFTHWLDAETKKYAFLGREQKISSPAAGIHAHLAKLPPPSERLDLEHLAKKLSASAQVTLEAVIEELAGKLGDQVISFSEILDIVRVKSPETSRIDLLFALLPFCANHPRSVFLLNVRNRLVVTEGKFCISTTENVTAALLPFDRFLAVVINQLEFDKPHAIPSANWLHQVSGVLPAHHRYLITSLLQIGLLYTANDLYLLSDGFEWSGRFRLFKRALSKWNERLAAWKTGGSNRINVTVPRPKSEPSPPKITELFDIRAPRHPPIAIPWFPPVSEPTTGFSEGTNDSESMEKLADLPEDLLTKRIKPPKFVISKDKLRAEAGMSEQAINGVSRRADKVLFELMVLVARESSVISAATLEHIVRMIRNGITESKEIIEKTLSGTLPGAPALFHVVIAQNTCFVRLLEITPEEELRLPMTMSAIRSLSPDELANLKDPYELEFRKTINRHLPSDQSLSVDNYQKRHENEFKKNLIRIINTTEKVYCGLINLLIETNSHILPFDKITGLAHSIGGPLPIEQKLSVLNGSNIGIVRLFSFEISGRAEKQHCKVRLLSVRPESLEALPKTKDALNKLSPYMRQVLIGGRVKKAVNKREKKRVKTKGVATTI